MKDSSRFPTYEQLWQGSLLATIAHAISIAKDPELAYEHSWHGSNYSLQNSMGVRGTIVFDGGDFVAVFFDAHSTRNPFRSEMSYNYDFYFVGMPAALQPLSDSASMHILEDYYGLIMPVVTAAFWGHGTDVTAVEPWLEVVRHGAHLVHTNVLPPTTAIAEWQENYELVPSQVALLGSLFGRRMTTESTAVVVLEPWEQDIMMAFGTEGIDQSRELLASIGIILP